MWVLELPLAVVNFETENNVVFTKFFCFQTENMHCSARLAIQTELKGQKLQHGSLGIFCKYSVNTKRKISPNFQGSMS